MNMMDKNEIELIIEQIKKEVVPIGSILIYSSEKVPDNYLPCDGRELPKQLFPELYALIGSTWGETTTTFFLPDLQGQFVRGWDREQNVDPERKFGSYQEDTLQGHMHEIKVDSNGIRTEWAGSHKHFVYYYVKDVRDTTGLNCTDAYMVSDNFGNYKKTSSEGSHRHDISVEGGFVKVMNPTSSTCGIIRYTNETRPKNIALMFCIKVH